MFLTDSAFRLIIPAKKETKPTILLAVLSHIKKTRNLTPSSLDGKYLLYQYVGTYVHQNSHVVLVIDSLEAFFISFTVIGSQLPI